MGGRSAGVSGTVQPVLTASAFISLRQLEIPDVQYEIFSSELFRIGDAEAAEEVPYLL